MSPIFPTLLFATAAAAQTITTSIWLQSGESPEESLSSLTFYGSVIGASKDRTTIALDLDETFTGFQLPGQDLNTVTIGGLTYVEAHLTTSVSIPGEKGDATLGVTCTQATTADARPVCTMSAGGNLPFLQYCAGYGTRNPITYVQTYTEAGSSSTDTVTYTQTISADIGDQEPDFCSEGKLPESLAIEVSTAEATESFGTYALVLTAGVEKLSATTKAGASSTGPTPTGSASGTRTTGSAGPEQTGSSSGTAAGAPANTGLAAPMMTPAAALAAVAMAALVL